MSKKKQEELESVTEVSGVSITMAAATSIEVTAALEPENASNKAVTWSSDAEEYAVVTETDNPATITAVATGSCTITVTTDDGSFTDTVAVTVT
jgi:uncharacterized protein YjdB